QIFREGVLLGWSGMRGIITLTIALALPLLYPDGTPIQERDNAIYLAFLVTLFTLLLPGFTFSSLLKWLRIPHVPTSFELAKHRKKLLATAEKEIGALVDLNTEDRSLLLSYFQNRHRILEISSSIDNPVKQLQAGRLRIFTAQRELLLKMWEKKEIDDKLLK